MIAPYEVYQLKAGFSNIINYMYIVVDKFSRQTIIVDPAWDLDQITAVLERVDVLPVAILLTHSHSDHMNLVYPLVEKYGMQVYMSAKEIDFYHFECPNLIPLQDFDMIHFGGTRILCLVTPGHTAGGICYLLSDSIFTGDTIFIEGCGICDMVGGSADQMFESIQKIKRIVDPLVRVYPGHSYGEEPGHPLGYLLENNIYFVLTNKEYFISFRMRKNQKNLFNFK